MKQCLLRDFFNQALKDWARQTKHSNTLGLRVLSGAITFSYNNKGTVQFSFAPIFFILFHGRPLLIHSQDALTPGTFINDKTTGWIFLSSLSFNLRFRVSLEATTYPDYDISSFESTTIKTR